MARDESVDTADHEYPLPDITHDDDFSTVIKKLSIYFHTVIELPSTFEQLRTTAAGACLRHLVEHLSGTCHNPAIVNALLALKWHYDTDTRDHILNEARSSACEIVAWRFLACLSDSSAVQFCLYEIPDPRIHRRRHRDGFSDEEEQQPQSHGQQREAAVESTPLLQRHTKRNSDGTD
ncbi:hypothetical protein NQ176_g8512 [Zarea fungicola]|uniref:Uncharacterized protein n=1 Tax=Zarea fungicola TaxID=93591 RepID=A0ACC1MU60_9HYPO|nr:hypothetical protein NQ176_g8512 [Lecanicillium fungicola]